MKLLTHREVFHQILKSNLSIKQVRWLANQTACGPSAIDVVRRLIKAEVDRDRKKKAK